MAGDGAVARTGRPSLAQQARHLYSRLYTRHWADCFFVHINKTGGSSIRKALNLPIEHRTARDILADVGVARWSSRFSFAIVRNPWDKVVSHYHYRVKTNQTGLAEQSLPFREWVALSYGAQDPRYYDKPRMFMPQYDWVCDDAGSVIVDFIGRFETLEADFTHICQRLGRTAELPHLKQSVRGDYRTLYDDETAGIVARWFARDIEHFDYRFDGISVRK